MHVFTYYFYRPQGMDTLHALIAAIYRVQYYKFVKVDIYILYIKQVWSQYN